MFAGQKAFEGASALKVIAAITHTEPPPIAALQSAHPLLDHVLRRCLEKDPERRWQNIGDVAGELRWIGENPVAAPVATASPDRSRRVGRLAIVATVALGTWRGGGGRLRRPCVEWPWSGAGGSCHPLRDRHVADRRSVAGAVT